jgi:uncharacterized protein YbcC (UPF0753/DUF2309 family)
MKSYSGFIHRIKHYLPTQNPLKDFVHHNTLHAFQQYNFHKGIHLASQTFGYQVYLTLDEYRKAFRARKINPQILERCIKEQQPQKDLAEWKEKLLNGVYDETQRQKVGSLRKLWKDHYKANPDKQVHTVLFRAIGGFLDQGIGVHSFPFKELPFLDALKALESNSFASFFKTKRPKALLLNEDNLLGKLLEIVVGDESFIEHYLFDQQFAHPGWSGMVSVLEDHPELLIDQRKISLHDIICFELLLEIDALDSKFGEIWKPLALAIPKNFEAIVFPEVDVASELHEVYKIWQEAFEWTYYDEVLRGLQTKPKQAIGHRRSFQAVFCIDDREGSIRRYLEQEDPDCETLSIAGFFNVPIYFQPEEGKFATKVCPAPLTPKHLVKESNASKRHKKDAHFSKHTHGFFSGLITAPTIGFWSAIQLGWSILFPRPTAAMVSSFNHMAKGGNLSIEYEGKTENHLQVGFTIKEMVGIVAGILRGIALTEDFAPLVYFMGHGASSTNNTHYAGYDCGACSGRAGSANARIAAYMANKPEVRKLLAEEGIVIPESTQFIAGLHDTTRDEVDFFDEQILSDLNEKRHEANKEIFFNALENNANERARRFLFISPKRDKKKVHQKVKQRSLSLFEPRPEWNHATNALCIIGHRNQNKHLFFDRRAFLNSYDYRLDKDGSILLGILNAVAPVCGGINLEYYFSKMDNYRLGAGTKLPHNVIGLIGVANGMEGDLRTGLPMQMVNIHDPLRLLVTIEHFPDDVLEILRRNKETFEWFQNAWIHLAVIHPESKAVFVFKENQLVPYIALTETIEGIMNIPQEILDSSENLPVYQLI